MHLIIIKPWVMRKSLCIMILLMVCPKMWGQDSKVNSPQKTRIAYCLKAGGSISVMDPVSRPGSTVIDQYHAINGGYIGAFIHRPLASRWAFRPELLVSFYGFGARHDAGYTFMNPPDDHYSMCYISLPLLLQYAGPAGMVIHGGLQPGIVVDRFKELKPADLACAIGMGHNAPSGIGVEVRYTAGLVNLVNMDFERTYLGKVKNEVVQVGLMYTINKEKNNTRKADVLTKLLIR